MNDGPKRDWIVLIIVVLLGIALGTLQNRARANGSVDPVTQIVRSALQPAISATDGIADNADEFWRGVRDAKTLRVENQRLKDELNAVSMYAESEKRLQDEIDRLQGLLDLEPKGKTKVYASIIGYTPSKREFMIDAGSNQGIKINQPVVTARGLLGIVSTVEPGRSNVLLLLAPTVKLVAILETSPVKTGGLIEGSIGDRLVLNVQEKAEITAGTEVLTSAYAVSIPGGIPIGTVLEVHEDDVFGGSRVYVLPYARLTMSQEVAVLK